MSKREIEAQIPDIADFTDLGDFLQLPMKIYSAGMQARLTFAISTALQHDILLIDEGIGAGDAAFQEKAQKRIEGLFARSSIVLLASHSEALIKKYCNRTVQMEHGRMVHDEPLPSVLATA
jgi:ABC-2 type transport system ATP-binding protein/lipopolysaccharide transport system ATP-binding protein